MQSDIIRQINIRYARVMHMLNNSNLSPGALAQFNSSYSSICHAAPEVLVHKLELFALICIQHHKELVDKGLDDKLRNIISGTE